MNTQLGKIIRFHRKKAGLSQKELGDLAEVGKTVVFDVEKGRLSVRYEAILKLLHVLNVKIEFHSAFMKAFKEQDEKS